MNTIKEYFQFYNKKLKCNHCVLFILSRQTSNIMLDNSQIATVGYILGGSVFGYIFGRAFDANIIESILVGSAVGCSMGLVKQYKRSSKTEIVKDTNGNETIIKHGDDNSFSVGKVIAALLAWKLAIPLTILGGTVFVAVALKK